MDLYAKTVFAKQTLRKYSGNEHDNINKSLAMVVLKNNELYFVLTTIEQLGSSE